MVKKIRYAMLLLMAVNLACVAVVFLGGHEPPPPVPLPNPNGYDTLLKAAQLLASQTNPAPVLAADSEVVRLVRTGLQQECRVPIEYSISYDSNHVANLGGIRMLAQVLQHAARAAETNQHPGDASCFQLDTVRLGVQSSRGGLIIDQLNGLALESLGRGGLKRLVPTLGLQDCRRAAAELPEVNRLRESFLLILARDSDWEDRVVGHAFRVRLAEMIQFRSLNPGKAIRQHIEAQTKANERDTSLLILDLAAREYLLEKGVPPTSTADLVPAYLKAVPRDPFTGTNLVWTP